MAKVQVRINGQRVEQLPSAVRDTKSKDLIVYVEQMYDGGVQVFSEHFDVATNGQYIMVHASNYLRNKTCGICGDFNGEKVAEMKSPKDCPLSSGSAFVASYAFQSQEQNDRSQCKVDRQLKRQIQEEERQCLTDESYFANNPPKYQAAQLAQSGNCEEQVNAQTKKIVYEIVNNFLKPSVWQTEKRHRYAQQVSQKIGEQSEKFLREGTADKIGKAVAQAASNSIQLLPVGSHVARVAAKGVQPLLRRAVRHAVNPICQKSSCCSPSLYSAQEIDEVESEISYALADSAESTETNIPYIDQGAQSKLSCQKILQKQLQASLPKQVFFALQEQNEQDQVSSKQITTLVQNFKARIPKAVQETLQKQDGQLSDKLIEALDDVFGQQYQQEAHKQHSLIRQYTKIQVDELREATRSKCNYGKHQQQAI